MLTKFRCVNYNAKTNFFFRLFGIVLLLYIKLLLNYARNLNLSVSYVGTYVLLYGTSGNVRKASNDYLHLLFAVKNVLNEPRLEQVIVKIFINFCCEIYTKINRQLALVFYELLSAHRKIVLVNCRAVKRRIFAMSRIFSEKRSKPFGVPLKIA